jgi:hypothetical protein
MSDVEDFFNIEPDETTWRVTLRVIHYGRLLSVNTSLTRRDELSPSHTE